MFIAMTPLTNNGQAALADSCGGSSIVVHTSHNIFSIFSTQITNEQNIELIVELIYDTDQVSPVSCLCSLAISLHSFKIICEASSIQHAIRSIY